MKEKPGIPLEYQMTYQECAEQIGYKMMVYMGVMSQLGLSTFPHLVKTYIDPSTNDNQSLSQMCLRELEQRRRNLLIL